MARKKHRRKKAKKHHRKISGHKHRTWGAVKKHKRRVSGHPRKRRRKHGIGSLGAVVASPIFGLAAAGLAGFMLGKKLNQ